MTATAGYSGTPLPKKLGIKEGFRVAFVDAPEGFTQYLGALPEEVRVVPASSQPLDLIVLFVTAQAALVDQFSALAARLRPAGMLWVGWPKRSSGVATDLDENVIREIGLAAGLVDVKVCAIDEIWSGLKFVYRLKDRPAL